MLERKRSFTIPWDPLHKDGEGCRSFDRELFPFRSHRMVRTMGFIVFGKPPKHRGSYFLTKQTTKITSIPITIIKEYSKVDGNTKKNSMLLFVVFW